MYLICEEAMKETNLCDIGRYRDEEPPAKNTKIPRILLLDDENEIVDLCAKVLRKKYTVVKTSSPFEAVSFMDAGRRMIDLVICDYNMPGLNGSEFVDKIRDLGITTPVILCTGQLHKGDPRFAKILEKPFDGEMLLREIATVLAVKRTEGDIYRRYRGLLPYLTIVLEHLETALKNRGTENSPEPQLDDAPADPNSGDIRHVRLAWQYLNHLRAKIEE